MASEQTDTRTVTKRIAWCILATIIVVCGILTYLALKRPPQMGADEDVFKTVDALYTAVRNQDEERLDQCERRLHEHRDAGKLPKKTADHLDGIIARARAGRWESAAEKLYVFMLAQQREG